MELEISQSILSRALNIATRVASGRAGLPILNNVLFKAEADKLTIIATNLEVAIQEHLKAKVTKSGTITVPARLLAESIGTLPRGSIKLTVDGAKIGVEAENYKSTILGLASDDYPELPVLDEGAAVSFTVNVAEFKQAVAQTVVAASSDTSRPVLTGVFFNTFEDDLYLAATDGYRLAEKRFMTGVDGKELEAVVPTSSLQEVIRSIGEGLEEMTLLFDQDQVKFRLGGGGEDGEIEVTSKLIDGSFPNYRQLIPKTTDVNLKLDKSEFLRMTKLAGLFARDSGGSIILETSVEKGVLSIASVASERGENTSDLKTKVDTDGKITLNSRFLTDGLGSAEGDEVDFGFSGKMAPAILREDGYNHIIMPLKS